MNSPTESWTGLVGRSALAAIVLAYKKSDQPLLVLCHHESMVQDIKDDLTCLFAWAQSQYEVFHFPAKPLAKKISHVEDQLIASERLRVLSELKKSRSICVVVSIEALAQLTSPKSKIETHSGIIEVSAIYDRDSIVQELVKAGYDQDVQVTEPGTFSVRGSILDIYSPNHKNPVRVEFIGDEIESLRYFDPSTQRSLEPTEQFIWMASRENLISADMFPQVELALKTFCDDRQITPRVRLEIIESIRAGKSDNAIESLMPLFISEKNTILDFIDPKAQLLFLDPYAIEREIKDIEDRYEEVENEQIKNQVVSAPPRMHMIDFKSIMRQARAFSHVDISDVQMEGAATKVFQGESHQDLRQNITFARKKENPLEELHRRIRQWQSGGVTIVIVAHTDAGQTRLSGLLKPYFKELEVVQAFNLNEAGAIPKLLLIQGTLSHGFYLKEALLCMVTEADIFGERKHVAKVRTDKDLQFNDLKELSPGDYVVHLDHGIGIYRGLQRLKFTQVEGDFLLIEYAEKDKLFLPVYRLNRVHKYVGAEGHEPRLDRLGNPQAWDKARARAKKAAEEMANELIELYAARQVAKRKPYGLADQSYLAFEEDFPYEETRDQVKALQEIAVDLQSGKPMDRLVCGDVGFGKTEIALRAAFRTATEGMQVAVLVPTTILAQQHYETFKKRMESYPITVDFVSRFKEPKEQKEIVQKLKDGKLDIVIGTHRLLSKDVSFNNLGLLVLDEEHRFGVKHKEAIKKYRNLVHVLTLTATPIPRTLQLSMTGIRDLSIINTPPLDRKSVETVLCKFDDETIRIAIEKELSRNGQVFFVHNRVETIDAMATYLKKMAPAAKVKVGHAQMPEDKLEETMLGFLRKDFDVLVCTTIVESGLDIPNANTIMINRADCFGLAQLYQLRGRVGRSDRHAYCYLLVPGEDAVSRDAMKRLKAIKRFTELGSGLKIAMHDLEIRGGGNLLGSEQSGHISDVGFEFYSQLLEREIKRRKGEKLEQDFEPEIQISRPAFLPETYVPDSQERLVIYKRLSGTKTKEDLQAMQQELVDRFGKLPPTTESLIEIIELKILARNLGISALKLAGTTPTIEFSDQAKINLDKLLAMVKKDKRMKLRPDHKLQLEIPSDYDMVAEARRILENL